MADDFGILFELLERHGREVSGRAAPNISDDIRAKLANMAAGKCDEERREELVKVLHEQPDLVPLLAQEILKLRKSPR
jgi:hypothetical protein